MNLMQAIHARWADSAALCALLPAARLFTDAEPGATLPCAVASLENRRPTARYGDGTSADLATVRIEILADRSSTAGAILTEVVGAFDRTSLPLADGGRVLDMQRRGENRKRQPDGTWLVTIDFECIVLSQ